MSNEATGNDIREAVRERYANAAREAQCHSMIVSRLWGTEIVIARKAVAS